MGQDPALTDIPHMAMHSQGYQAMITDDDDWLKDFATAQLQADHSPESVHNGPEAEEAGEPITPDHNMSQSAAHASLKQQDKAVLDPSVLELDSQVKRLACHAFK